MSDITTQKYNPGEHPDLPAPVATTGIVGWFRLNLFNGPWNSVLTLVTLVLLVMYIPPALAWLTWDSVLFADSRAACREIGSGACWAVVVERFDQFMFYQYPDSERWRPVLAFLLLFPALYPLLFDEAPKRGTWFIFSAYYPWIGFTLVYGGLDIQDFWNWVIFAGGGLLIALYGFIANLKNPNYSLVTGGMTKTGLYWFTAGLLAMIGGSVLDRVPTSLMGGFTITVLIGVPAILVSLPIGVGLALGRRSNLPAVSMLCTIFIEMIRGVPLITILFVADTMLNYFLPPDIQFDKLLRVQVMVTFFAAGYIAEVVRGGLQAIPKGQYEAADAMGLKYWESMRLVILPQALKISIPGIVGVFIGLYKDTTLVSIIGMLDPLGVAKPVLADNAWNGLSIEVYVFLAIFYFIACFAMSRYSLWLEKRLDTGHGAAERQKKRKADSNQTESTA